MSEDTGDVKRWPGYSDEARPHLFNSIPPQPKQLKPGQLDEEQIRKFFDEGYIIVESILTPEVLEPAKRAIARQVDELANKLFSAGKISDLYSDYGVESRLTMLEKEFPGANILLHKLGHLPKEFQDIWSNERLLNVVEQILGTSDITGHPVWNLRTKTPNNEATTSPWHQDAAYMDNRAYEVFQLTAWIPLLDANEENGCMQVARYGHKTGRVATHTCCTGDTWYIDLSEDEIHNTLNCDLQRDIVTVPVNYGSALLFSNVMPHKSLNNRSDQVRWSLDFRWQRADKPCAYYDMMEGVQMRSSTDPNFQIDWDAFINVKRHDTQIEKPDEFDTTISGPWMLKWEMTNHNRHGRALKKGDTSSWQVYG